MDSRADSFKATKRMRLNSGQVVDSCMWDLHSNMPENGCKLGLSLGDSASLKGKFSASCNDVDLAHRRRSFQPSSSSAVDVSPDVSPAVCAYDVGNLDLTMSLSKTETVRSWTSEESFCSEESDNIVLPVVELGLGLTLMSATSCAESVVTSSFPSADHVGIPDVAKTNQVPNLPVFCQEGSLCVACNTDVPMIDEGSTSNGGYFLPFLKANEAPKHSCWNMQQFEPAVHIVKESPVESEISLSFNALSGTTSTSGTSTGTGFRERAPKMCRFTGCTKRARGASGLCISHGGGRRCQRLGCKKGAEGSTIFCKAHGGGRRCQHLGCTKSAEGKTDFCIAHGGGSRCSFEGCPKAARGRTGYCIRHGGGKRCQRPGCTKSAEGYSALCIAHGGGKRCQYPDCGKGAQGSTMFCKGHGGGKRCTVEGCNKGAEGSTSLCKAHGGGKRCMFNGGGVCSKSVHGGTLFCVAHGGGKRCVVEGCTKSARGRTDCCVKHGGGKRCKFENCDKSAQGSTDFCKAHGGGKRCMWGQESFLRYGQDVTGLADSFKGFCDKTAKGKLGLCAEHTALVQDQRVHGIGAFSGSFSSSGQRIGQNGLPQYCTNDNNNDSHSNEGYSRGLELEDQWHLLKGKDLTSRGFGQKQDKASDILLSSSVDSGYALHVDKGYASNVTGPFGMHIFPSKLSPETQHGAFTQVFGVSSMHWQTSRDDAHRQGGSSDMDDDRVFNMSSLSLPEERVHGGNIMAFLSSGGPQGKLDFH
ncbi:hypothetical protein KP509_37G044100 [Ceratopteris richardii]|uniref:WRKY19-like zinc finger domain-containing protein n=1 Tax=Ceratopteris richardii TaxID=49495 RepID=A0A8T2Q7H3_CERRI|nr:hypothetical protein KP509_37G044100 [Ceratopteris richardii]KAH7279932.1 hypothetical protein KP509_37G044100 [Ceratopteris richardii]